tara:strand:+ start:276 stop:422 length:147 start_codon:yes stop_codon:yes gene_type:complete
MKKNTPLKKSDPTINGSKRVQKSNEKSNGRSSLGAAVSEINEELLNNE